MLIFAAQMTRMFQWARDLIGKLLISNSFNFEHRNSKSRESTVLQCSMGLSMHALILNRNYDYAGIQK
jgi:hypothetical protein